MSEELEQLCKDYLADNLPPRRRKQVEQRIANGDAEIISTINRLRSFQKPGSGSQNAPNLSEDDPSLLGAFMSQEDRPSPKSDESKPKPSDQNNVTAQKSTAGSESKDEFEAETKERSITRVRLLQIAGGLIIILLLFFIYYQWQNQLLERELQVTSDQVERLTKKLDLLERSERRTARQFNLLKTIIRSNLFERIDLSTDHPNWKSGLMVWDRSTLRTGWLINEANLPENHSFYIWTADKNANWRYAGSIDQIKRDSLYTNWDNTAFNQARRLQVRLDTLNALSNNSDHQHGELIGTFSMPR